VLVVDWYVDITGEVSTEIFHQLEILLAILDGGLRALAAVADPDLHVVDPSRVVHQVLDWWLECAIVPSLQ